MAYVIAQPCVDRMDQSCVEVCPVDCITADPGPDRKFYIDPDGCIECGSCESACNQGAIFPDWKLPAEWSVFASIDATYYADPEAARDAVEQFQAA